MASATISPWLLLPEDAARAQRAYHPNKEPAEGAPEPV